MLHIGVQTKNVVMDERVFFLQILCCLRQKGYAVCFTTTDIDLAIYIFIGSG